jgi:hypothetical protein
VRRAVAARARVRQESVRVAKDGRHIQRRAQENVAIANYHACNRRI